MQDNNIERRNLTVMSMAFILYYAGDAKFKDNTISLPLTTLEFKNLEELGFIAWVVLFWFLIRYVQLHWKKIKKDYMENVDGHIRKIRDNFFNKVTKLEENKDYNHSSMNSSHIFLKKTSKGTNGRIKIMEEKIIKIPLTIEIRMLLETIKRYVIITDGFTSNIAPYLLFTIALLYGFGIF